MKLDNKPKLCKDSSNHGFFPGSDSSHELPTVNSTQSIPKSRNLSKTTHMQNFLCDLTQLPIDPALVGEEEEKDQKLNKQLLQYGN